MRGRSVGLKRPSFGATIQEIETRDASRLYGFEEAVRYWTRGEQSAEEWVDRVRREWGSCGLYASRGEEVLGFCFFAPPRYLEKFREYPFDSEAWGPGRVVLACSAGDARTEKRIILRMLRDFKLRGVSGVSVAASDGGRQHHVCTRSLNQMGWKPVRRTLHLGRFYTLFELELGDVVEAGEFARALIGQVRLPHLRRSSPGSLASRAFDEVMLAFTEAPGEGRKPDPEAPAEAGTDLCRISLR
ncbi:hypothetical protein [Rubrobacter indicoceani]|uniref:hypothetical protein n=1 Tax=Rubrobacter indicoceani TaxID=2051957 RepID=UPI000E5A559F|nr:hypothetical protein [Rubrobacter indicoceani]